MIRHARRGRPLPLPIPALPVAVIEPAFRAALRAPVGATLLLEARLAPALVAAIAMSAITMRADGKKRLTLLPAARSLEQNRLRMKGRVQRH